ncbi:hypothetical protein JR334_00490 [Clostridia bacterium]|nr:hypothetical protein JR334_00490 [Clostridia bacterium]
MKKMVFSLVLIVIFCMGIVGTAFAQGESGAINSAGYDNRLENVPKTDANAIGREGFCILAKSSYQRQQAFITLYKIWQSLEQVNTKNVEVSLGTSATNSGFIPTFDSRPYHTDFKAEIEGTSIKSGETVILKYDVYYKNGNIKIDSYYQGRLVASAIYHDTAFVTFTTMTMGTNYAEVLEGNWLPFRFLDRAYYEALEHDPEVASFRFENQFLNDEKVTYMETLMTDGSMTKQWYSQTYKMPVKFHREWYNGDALTLIDWVVTNIDESVTLEDSMFNIPSDAEFE